MVEMQRSRIVRDYFEAKWTYLQMQGITPAVCDLETKPFEEVRKTLKNIDLQAEKSIPNYWQNMYSWYQNWGKEKTGQEEHTFLLKEPDWEKIPQEDRSKGTLQMLERYFAGEMTRGIL